MSDFGENLLRSISEAFTKKVRSDRKLRQIANRVRDGTDYAVANEYAVRIGEMLSDSILGETGSLSYMSHEVAEEVLTPLLTADHDLVADVCETIQTNMNKANGIGLAPQVPKVDTDRINGFVDKVASYDEYDKAKWMMKEPLVNYSENTVDDAVRDNAKVSDKAGIKTTIVRKAEAYQRIERKGKRKGSYTIPCDWCKALEGTYDYSTVKNTGNDVYRRHDGCRCTVTFTQGTKRQDVWSKAVWTDEDAKNSANLIEQKQAEQQAKRDEQIRRTQTRKGIIEEVQKQLGYSDRGASIFVNQYKDDIDRFGIGYMIDYARNHRLNYR